MVDVIVEGTINSTKLILVIAFLIFIVYNQFIEYVIIIAVLILQSFAAPIIPGDEEPKKNGN